MLYPTVVGYRLFVTASLTVVDTLSRALAGAILDGTWAAGARLPSVRALAAEHQVNVSTVQRVLARLSELGLVRAHDRRGVEVCDVSRLGGAALWPLRMQRAAVDPQPALALVDDALAIRRMLAGQVLRALVGVDFATYGPELDRAVQAFVAATEDPTVTPAQLLAIETEAMRTLLLAARRPAVLAIVNDVHAMMTATPVLLDSIYQQPQVNAQAWEGLVLLLRMGLAHPDGVSDIEMMLAELDAVTLQDFRRRIGARP